MGTILHNDPPHRDNTFGNDAIVYTWESLTVSDIYGNPVKMPGSADRSVQITGALGSGGAITMYGSNVVAPDLSDDDDWFVLRDAGFNPLVLSSLTGEEVVTLPLWIRPKLTAGDGETDLTVHLVMKGNHL